MPSTLENSESKGRKSIGDAKKSLKDSLFDPIPRFGVEKEAQKRKPKYKGGSGKKHAAGLKAKQGSQRQNDQWKKKCTGKENK